MLSTAARSSQTDDEDTNLSTQWFSSPNGKHQPFCQIPKEIKPIPTTNDFDISEDIDSPVNMSFGSDSLLNLSAMSDCTPLSHKSLYETSPLAGDETLIFRREACILPQDLELP